MAKFLVKASYSSPGVRGVLEDGGTARQKAVTDMIESLGGKVEAFYFAFGDVDTYTIIDMPDNVSALAMSLAVAARGLATTDLIALVTPAELDAAVKMTPTYDAPGKADN
jgi:uncharacterized protein with GYD domain